MSKHSEGPWTVDAKKQFRIIDANGTPVAVAGDRNAHLIAAAPDTLEALKALNDLFDGDGFRIDLAANLPQLLSKADAALSKAEGRRAIKEQSSL